MLDQLDLVHMNGRIYDPLMARFLSADPFIAEPTESQSYNRYTYVWNNPTNLTDPTGFLPADTGDLLSDTLTFIKSGLGFTESKSEPANEKTKTTGSADNSGGQGKSSQTVTVTGSLAQARAEQWLLAKTIEAAYGARDYAVRIAPVVRTAAFRAAPRALAAQTFHEIPVVGQAIGIVGGTYFLYSVGKAIFHAGDGKSDTSAEQALSGTNSASLPPGGPDGDENDREKTVDEKRAKHIFRDKEGHLSDTLSNRNLLNDVANNPRNRVSVDKYGNEWFARTDANGNQVWAQVRGDRIINGGVNNPPRTPNAQTGLSAPGWK